jgi:hypothetical protein
MCPCVQGLWWVEWITFWVPPRLDNWSLAVITVTVTARLHNRCAEYCLPSEDWNTVGNNPLQMSFFCMLWGVHALCVLCAVFWGQIYNSDYGQSELLKNICGIASIVVQTLDPFSSHHKPNSILWKCRNYVFFFETSKQAYFPTRCKNSDDIHTHVRVRGLGSLFVLLMSSGRPRGKQNKVMNMQWTIAGTCLEQGGIDSNYDTGHNLLLKVCMPFPPLLQAHSGAVFPLFACFITKWRKKYRIAAL